MPDEKVIHIIPYDGIGGVESAARSLPAGHYESLALHKCFLTKGSQAQSGDMEYHGPETYLDNPVVYFRALRHLKAQSPDLIIASLWRSVLVLLLYKIVRSNVKSVVFLHSIYDAHFFDGLINRIGMSLATEVWTDSQSTLHSRVPEKHRGKSKVISFQLSKPANVQISSPKPEFIFWGRLNQHKAIDRSIKIFSRVLEQHPDASFTIIGPDGGSRAKLQSLCDDLGISARVQFLGPMEIDEILETASAASFYLQTSLMEGMAISVVEAMQNGLVPVVTPVGEIANYCTDGVNAIFVQDDNDEQVVEVISDLLHRPDAYKQLAQSAMSYWLEKPFYRDDVLQRIRAMLQ